MIRLASALLAVALVAGCANRNPPPVVADPTAHEGPVVEPLASVGNHSPYRVLGKTYHVLPTSRGYVERGTASWYGPNFHGKPTSSLEPFDMHSLSAAHRSLPLPTYARVTNLENDRSVVVRVNDRGPFKSNRIIDLSFAAARAIGMVDQGTAQVEVRALVPESAVFDRPLVATKERLYLQLGAFGARENALKLVARLRDAEIETTEVISDGALHRVRIGPLDNAEVVDGMTASLLLMGLDRPVVIFE